MTQKEWSQLSYTEQKAKRLTMTAEELALLDHTKPAPEVTAYSSSLLIGVFIALGIVCLLGGGALVVFGEYLNAGACGIAGFLYLGVARLVDSAARGAHYAEEIAKQIYALRSDK